MSITTDASVLPTKPNKKTKPAPETTPPEVVGSADVAAKKGASAYQADPYNLTKAYTMVDPNDPSKLGLPMTDPADYAALKQSYDAARAKLGTSIDQMSEANQPFLKGEIPVDVMAQIRRVTSEASIGQGLFGSGSRALTAQDIGLTSMDIKSKGLAQQDAITQRQAGLAALDMQRQDMLKTYDLNVVRFQDQVRNTNLSGLKLEQARLQFNASQNLGLMQLASQLLIAREQLGFQYANVDIDSTGMQESMDNLMKQVSGAAVR